MLSAPSSLFPSSVKIKEYLSSRCSSGTTTHIYETKTPCDIRKCILKISDHIQIALTTNDHIISRVPEMNELYSSICRGTSSSAGSDAVFETEHIDGPFGIFPGYTLYRCVFTITNDCGTKTVIQNKEYDMKPLDFVVIDYNRDLHRISSPTKKGDRYVIKLHFAKTPLTGLIPLKWTFIKLNVLYNTLARKLFLFTLNPQTTTQKIANYIVNSTTRFFARMWRIKKNTNL